MYTPDINCGDAIRILRLSYPSYLLVRCRRFRDTFFDKTPHWGYCTASHIRIRYQPDTSFALCSSRYRVLLLSRVMQNERCRIHWNSSFLATRFLTTTKSDIVLFNRDKKLIIVIKFSSSTEYSTSIKENKKRTKFQNGRASQDSQAVA